MDELVLINKIKRRLEKMNFLTQERKIEPMTQDDKYLLKVIEQQRSIEKQNENIPRFTRGSLRS